MTKINALFIALCMAMPLHAKIIYVNQSATGQNNGSSWADAFKNLNTALPTAQYGDEIWVAKGAYFPFPAAPILSFVLVNGTKLLGGFDGVENSSDQRDWMANETILYGDEPGFTWLNVVYGEGTDATTLLDGFTIRGGHADITLFGLPCSEPNGADCIGGGLYLYNDNPDAPTTLTVRNCRFLSNGALQGGGIAANFAKGSGGLIVEKCYFNDNSCNDVGGAIFIETSLYPQQKIQIDSCLFEYNDGNTSSCISVHNTNNQLDFNIKNSVFQFNKAYYSCAGIYIGNGSYAQPVVENCTFYHNEAGGTNQFLPSIGGALLGSNFRIISCIFQENKARSGGAISVGGGQILNCLFLDNYAKWEGGALRLSRNNYITNCTFYNNRADKIGGSIYNIGSAQDTILNCIFVGNRAGESGDWMASNFGNDYVDYTVIDVEDCEALKDGLHPVYDTLTCGSNMFFNIDPLFRDTSTGDFRLRGCSPLLNQGDSAWATRFGLLTDLDGNSRWIDGLPDIGAYETQISESLQLVSTLTPSTSLQNPNGSIVINTVTGGTMPYTYTWNTGSTENAINNLATGTYNVTIADQQGCVTLKEFEILLVSGVSQADTPGNMLIYPNPAKDWVRVLLPEIDDNPLLEVVDASGKTLYTESLLRHEKVFNLNINEWAPGIYTLFFKQNERIIYTEQFIKGQ